MAALNQIIPAKVVGDSIPMERTYKVPNGITASKAYLTFKLNENDLDVDSVFPMIEITATPTTFGQITVPTSVAGSIAMRLRVPPEYSILCEPYVDYHFCVKIIASTGDPYTMEKGRITLAESGVGAAASRLMDITGRLVF